MPLDDVAVAHYYLLCRGGESPGVLVAPRLEHHGVVALVEAAVLDDGVRGHLHIDAVVVVAVGVHVESACPDVAAEVEVDGPERTLPDAEVLKPDIGASVELYQVRTHVGFSLLHPAVLHRNSGRAHGVELPGGLDMRFRPCEPSSPEIHLRGYGAGAGDADVLAPVRVDERGVVHAFGTFPRCPDGRQVELRVVLEDEAGTLAEVEEAAVAEMYGAGEPLSLRDDDPPAACLTAGLHGFAEGLSGRLDVALSGAVACNCEVSGGEFMHLQRFEVKGCFRRCHYGLGAQARGCRHREQRRG